MWPKKIKVRKFFDPKHFWSTKNLGAKLKILDTKQFLVQKIFVSKKVLLEKYWSTKIKTPKNWVQKYGQTRVSNS